MLNLTSLKVLFLRLFSRPVLAPVFIGMRKISNLGLNYNAAAMLSVENSGEGKVLDYIFSKLPHEQKLTLFDVGASVGEYIEAFINRCPSAYHIRAFEPTSASLAILRRKFCENSKVKIFACGLSEFQGEASIYFAYPGNNASLSLQTMEQQTNLPAFLDEVITLETLDKHLELFPCERIHLL